MCVRKWARGYERMKEEPFTPLLADIDMPKMDGIELASTRR
jgi:YesN/AraC family two-component response regulator